MYHVRFSENAMKDLKKLDLSIAKMILAWIGKHLESCDNPRVHGKGLVANKKGIWRYRVGDYRLLATIQDEILIILLIDVGHRKDIYK